MNRNNCNQGLLILACLCVNRRKIRGQQKRKWRLQWRLYCACHSNLFLTRRIQEHHNSNIKIWCLRKFCFVAIWFYVNISCSSSFKSLNHFSHYTHNKGEWKFQIMHNIEKMLLLTFVKKKCTFIQSMWKKKKKNYLSSLRAAVESGSVSYTHLDVYKRQAYYWTPKSISLSHRQMRTNQRRPY